MGWFQAFFWMSAAKHPGRVTCEKGFSEDGLYDNMPEKFVRNL